MESCDAQLEQPIGIKVSSGTFQVLGERSIVGAGGNIGNLNRCHINNGNSEG